jgi:hypothetical protein
VTLSTYVYVKDRVDHRAMFTRCNQLIGADEGTKFREDDDSIHNLPDQGLCAWLLIYHGHGEPHTTPEAAARHDEDCEPDCDGDHYDRACWARVNFDTTYSYSGPDGGCGDLHARLVAELGAWLDERGIDWEWRNEFTGQVHQRYDGLTELGGGGAEASDWFRNIARPAIMAHIAQNGGQ